MLNSLRKIFQQSEQTSKEDIYNDELELLCGLMIEAAQTDGKIDQEEIDQITDILINTFEENPADVKSVLQDCLKKTDESRSLHFFTSKLNKIFTENKKTLLVETLWEIILADGKIHEYESNLIRRLAGLLYISDISCGNAKKRALAKLDNL